MPKQPRHTEALDERIAAAFNEGATSASVGALLEEVDAAMTSAKEGALRARACAYAPEVPARDRIEPAGEMAHGGVSAH